MVSLEITVLRWLHLAFAIGWMGVEMLFVMILGPTLGQLTHPTRNEFLMRFLPRATRYIMTFALLTLFTGFALAFRLAGHNLSIFFASPWGIRVLLGATSALAAAALAFTMVIPASRKIVQILSKQQPATTTLDQGLPPELLSALRRLRAAPRVILLLLSIALAFMVLAAHGL